MALGSTKLLGILGVVLAACAPYSAEPIAPDSPSPPASGPATTADSETSPSPPDTTGQSNGTPPANTGCSEAGAKTFGGHCYFKVGSMTSYEATAECIGRGGHLVTINTKEEHDFAKTFSPNAHMWIGMMAVLPSKEESDFGWVTGEPVKLDAWARDQPNGDGACVAFDDEGAWIDHSCTTKYAALCERE